VIVFFTDQQRWDTVGLHGNPPDLTPNLDRAVRIAGPLHKPGPTWLWPSDPLSYREVES
jgi:hypothetical protein